MSMKRKWKTLAAIVLLILIAGYLILYGDVSSSSNNKESLVGVDSSKILLHKDHSVNQREHNSPHRAEIIDVEEEQKDNRQGNRAGEADVLKKQRPFDFAKPSKNARPKSVPLTVSDQDLKEVLDNVERCLEATNLTRLAPSEVAKKNAARYMKEYRKVIPTSDRFLDSCSNHCWATDYSTNQRLNNLEGHIGNVSFNNQMKDFRAQAVDVFRRKFFSSFSSKLVCLPKIFLAGFPKCGSSFLWCFMNRLIHQSENVQAEKEPHFWINAGAYKHFKEPLASDFSYYILNFVKGISQIEKDSCVSSNVSLMDGSPNLMFNWPRFNREDKDLANYCLIPATLPHFLPSAKFIVIMRNPVKMLYSAFWFSCTMYGIKLSHSVQLRGPILFHHRIEEKLNMFHDCMRDKNDPGISYECSLNDTSSYKPCITQRLHLLDECVHKIYFNIFGSDLPKCGRSRVAMGLYYAHIRKWLSVVPRERFLFLTLEELIADPVQTATSISRFLGVEQSAADIQKGAELASFCNENSQGAVNYKTSPNLQMRNDTKHMLETFYRPFNALLADLLQDKKFLWTS